MNLKTVRAWPELRQALYELSRCVKGLLTKEESNQVRNEMEELLNQTEEFRDEAEYFAYLTGRGWYGIEFDTTVAATAVTRIGNMDMHKHLPIHSRIRHCLLHDDGTVNYYTHPNNQGLKQNGQPADLTGTDGQRMIEFPESYWRFEIEGTKRRVKLSEFPLPGYFRRPPFYVSADGACIQRSTGKLASVVNLDPDYRGGDNNATWDAEARTLLGREVTRLDLTEFRDAARLRGTGWEGYNLMVHEIITWLIRIEYANLNCQISYNPENNGDGFRQGGLGPGVTTFDGTLWSFFNSQHPFIPTGIGTALGNNTGVMTYDITIQYAPVVQVEVPIWRGIANPFGHTWKWLDGVLFQIQADNAGGESRVFTTYNPESFSSLSFSEYELRGLVPRTNGYIKVLNADDFGSFFPLVASDSSSATFFCDSWYTLIPGFLEGIRGCMVGGTAALDTTAGLGCVFSNNSTLAQSTDTGSRLCFFPEHPLLTP